MEVNNRKTKKCPYCGEEILVDAKKCRYCGEWLEESKETETNMSQDETSENNSDIKENGLNSDEKTDNPVNSQSNESELSDNNSKIVSEESDKSPKDESEQKDKKRPKVSRKLIFGLISILLISFIAGGVIYHGKVEKEKKEAAIKAHQDSVEVFEKNVKTIKIEAVAIRKLSYLIFFDLRRNWGTAIFERYAYNYLNKKAYCNDIDEAIKWRKDYHRDCGSYSKLNNWNQDIAEKIKAILTPPEEKYKDLVDKLVNLYYKTKETVSFCNDPSGNYSSFENKYELLLRELDEAITATDLLTDSEEESGKYLYYSALTTELNEYIENVLTK